MIYKTSGLLAVLCFSQNLPVIFFLWMLVVRMQWNELVSRSLRSITSRMFSIGRALLAILWQQPTNWWVNLALPAAIDHRRFMPKNTLLPLRFLSNLTFTCLVATGIYQLILMFRGTQPLCSLELCTLVIRYFATAWLWHCHALHTRAYVCVCVFITGYSCGCKIFMICRIQALCSSAWRSRLLLYSTGN